MKNNTFYDFLNERAETNKELESEIFTLLDDLSDEEIDALGFYLDDEFFAGSDSEDDTDLSDEDEDFKDWYELSDVKEMITALIELDSDLADVVKDIINGDDDELELDDLVDGRSSDDEELDEGVSRRIKTKNLNRKKRKFVSKSVAQLRREKQERRKKTRQNKQKTKRYYRANKAKIKSYQKSRNDAIEKGKHNVKMRRRS